MARRKYEATFYLALAQGVALSQLSPADRQLFAGGTSSTRRRGEMDYGVGMTDRPRHGDERCFGRRVYELDRPENRCYKSRLAATFLESLGPSEPRYFRAEAMRTKILPVGGGPVRARLDAAAFLAACDGAERIEIQVAMAFDKIATSSCDNSFGGLDDLVCMLLVPEAGPGGGAIYGDLNDMNYAPVGVDVDREEVIFTVTADAGEVVAQLEGRIMPVGESDELREAAAGVLESATHDGRGNVIVPGLVFRRLYRALGRPPLTKPELSIFSDDEVPAAGRQGEGES
jgi:hypothetical protein